MCDLCAGQHWLDSYPSSSPSPKAARSRTDSAGRGAQYEIQVRYRVLFQMGQATMELPTYAGILEKRLLEYHITPWQYIQILRRYSVHMGSGDATVGINPPKSQRLASSSPPPRLSPALSPSLRPSLPLPLSPRCCHRFHHLTRPAPRTTILNPDTAWTNQGNKLTAFRFLCPCL